VLTNATSVVALITDGFREFGKSVFSFSSVTVASSSVIRITGKCRCGVLAVNTVLSTPERIRGEVLNRDYLTYVGSEM